MSQPFAILGLNVNRINRNFKEGINWDATKEADQAEESEVNEFKESYKFDKT